MTEHQQSESTAIPFGTRPALVLIVDEQGQLALYPMAAKQANTLRLTLGVPAWTAEGAEEREQMLTTASQVAAARALDRPYDLAEAITAAFARQLDIEPDTTDGGPT